MRLEDDIPEEIICKYFSYFYRGMVTKCALSSLRNNQEEWISCGSNK